MSGEQQLTPSPVSCLVPSPIAPKSFLLKNIFGFIFI
jgi:hypothetical protein